MTDTTTPELIETTIQEVYHRCLEGTFYYDWASGPALHVLKSLADPSSLRTKGPDYD